MPACTTTVRASRCACSHWCRLGDGFSFSTARQNESPSPNRRQNAQPTSRRDALPTKPTAAIVCFMRAQNAYHQPARRSPHRSFPPYFNSTLPFRQVLSRLLQQHLPFSPTHVVALADSPHPGPPVGPAAHRLLQPRRGGSRLRPAAAGRPLPLATRRLRHRGRAQQPGLRLRGREPLHHPGLKAGAGRSEAPAGRVPR